MAINNGNTDFKLYVFQEGTNDKKLRIQFTPYNNIVASNPINIRVYHPNGNVFTKTYSSGSKGVQITEYVDVPFYGEYRVHISTNQGYSWDMYQIGVKIRTSISNQKYKFTEQDVLRDKVSNLIISFTLTAAGGAIGGPALASGTLKGKITAGGISALMTTIGVFSGPDNTPVSADFPKKDWSYQVVMTQSGNAIIQTMRIWEPNGNEITPEVNSKFYPTF